jgi:hypothetical protein
MKTSEIKSLLISSMNSEADPVEAARKLEEYGISYDFSKDFDNKIIHKLFSAGYVINREVEFVRSMNFAFYRIALPGVAAIVFLLISIYLMEGSLSFNSFLGLGNSYDESIVCLLTGN